MLALRQAAVFIWIGLAAVLLAGCEPAPEQPVRRLKLSVAGSIDHSLYKGAIKFSDLVKARTQGKVIVAVYSDSQLSGSLIREIEMLRDGKIDFSFTSTLIYTSFDRRFFACSMPWLFLRPDAADKFLAGPVGRNILDMTRTQGIEGLALGENGFRQITNSRHAIRAPADIRGLRIRVPNEMYVSVYRALGAEPMIMPFPALYKALQEQTVDGQENPVEVIATGHLYEVQRHVTAWNYSYDAFILGANRRLYDSFDSHTQAILREAAREAAAYQIKLARESAQAKWNLLKEKGMEVTELTPAQSRAFQDRVKPLYAEYEPVIGKELLDALRAIDR
jgi:tripartite ATP-independent transporter DctP family solute receptor